MSIVQGAESNLTGSWLETTVELQLKQRHIPVFEYTHDLGNGHLFYKTRAVRRVPYTSIYGCHSVSEFVLHHMERSVRIECRVQETAGSVDEKFPYLLWNARDRMPENEVIIILHGEGARRQAVEWLRRECGRIESKRIRVQTLSEFYAWLKVFLAG